MTETEAATGVLQSPRLRRAMPALLAGAIVLAYLPSLSGSFLNYDDDWLVERNPVLHDASPRALATIWTGFGLDTRLALGAEYLPVRDTLAWAEARFCGIHALPFRLASLLLYIAGALLVRRWLRRALGPGAAAEIAAWLFALHPLHAESAAWIAGQKDLLALLFVAGALCAYSGTMRRRAVVVPLLVALACLGKAVAVAAPVLLLLHDLWVRRRPDARVLGASFAVAAAAVAVHGWVGHLVGMVAAPLGGSRAAAFVSMGPVWWEYLARSAAPIGLSVIHDAPARAATDALGCLAWADLALLCALAAQRWRRGDRRPGLGIAWFLVALAPTAQFVVPLQNATADRYLLLAVLAPVVALGLALAWLARVQRRSVALSAAVALCAGFGVATAARAAAFHDSVALFRDATAETTTSALPPYQLGKALQVAGDAAGAEQAFREAFARPDPPGVRCAAADNLAVLLARPERLADGIAVLRQAMAACPDNPKTLGDLAELLARAGRAAEARRLYDELVRRFPDYAVGRRNWELRYGAGRGGAAPQP